MGRGSLVPINPVNSNGYMNLPHTPKVTSTILETKHSKSYEGKLDREPRPLKSLPDEVNSIQHTNAQYRLTNHMNFVAEHDPLSMQSKHPRSLSSRSHVEVHPRIFHPGEMRSLSSPL